MDRGGVHEVRFKGSEPDNPADISENRVVFLFQDLHNITTACFHFSPIHHWVWPSLERFLATPQSLSKYNTWYILDSDNYNGDCMDGGGVHKARLKVVDMELPDKLADISERRVESLSSGVGRSFFFIMLRSEAVLFSFCFPFIVPNGCGFLCDWRVVLCGPYVVFPYSVTVVVFPISFTVQIFSHTRLYPLIPVVPL